jgi:erythronate-4-phosphate dehydrogenase
MKVVVDDKIPYIREALAQITDDAIYAPGHSFTPSLVHDADALIVRTRTRCDEALLGGSHVRFIATATIGYDHLDTRYLDQSGIEWANCPGSNAASVGQYVHSCLLLLKREKGLDLHSTKLGIVGVGHVGKEVLKAAQSLGMTCLLNDPPRQEKENGPFVSLEEVAREADIITFHVPLTKSGNHATYHLADETFFNSLVRRPVIINSSRGAVVDNEALLQALESNTVEDAIVDTWEGEPNINLKLLNKVYIGTPHIAGYSADGKANATRMALTALCRHFGLDCHFHIEAPSLPADFEPSDDMEEQALQLYNPLRDSEALKQYPNRFEYFREHYPLRREHL